MQVVQVLWYRPLVLAVVGRRRLAAGVGGLLTHFLLSLSLAWRRLDTAALETTESEPGVCLTHKLVLLI